MSWRSRLVTQSWRSRLANEESPTNRYRRWPLSWLVPSCFPTGSPLPPSHPVTQLEQRLVHSGLVTEAVGCVQPASVHSWESEGGDRDDSGDRPYDLSGYGVAATVAYSTNDRARENINTRLPVVVVRSLCLSLSSNATLYFLRRGVA